MSSFRENFLITQADVKVFAEAVGDPNPIHQDAAVAKAMGLEGPIAHGMFVYGYLLQRLDQWMAAARLNGVKWEIVSTRCRFHEPALIGKTFVSVLDLTEETAETGKMHLTLFDEAETKLTHVVAQLKKLT